MVSIAMQTTVQLDYSKR